MVSLISGRVPALNGVFFWFTLLCLMHFPKLALILSSHLQKNQKYYNRKHAHWMIKMCTNVACSWLKNVEKKTQVERDIKYAIMLHWQSLYQTHLMVCKMCYYYGMIWVTNMAATLQNSIFLICWNFKELQSSLFPIFWNFTALQNKSILDFLKFQRSHLMNSLFNWNQIC
jgi:hypothetical protein